MKYTIRCLKCPNKFIGIDDKVQGDDDIADGFVICEECWAKGRRPATAGFYKDALRENDFKGNMPDSILWGTYRHGRPVITTEMAAKMDCPFPPWDEKEQTKEE